MKNLDHKITKALFHATHASRLLTRLAIVGATYMIGVMAVVAGFVVWKNGHPLWDAMMVVAVAWGITLCLQLLVRRRRPFECQLYEAKVPLMCRTPSFPSAHATISFAIASLMFFEDTRIMWVFLLVAVWVSLSRVAVGVHFFSDMIVGALIGTFVPFLFFCFAFCLPH